MMLPVAFKRNKPCWRMRCDFLLDTLRAIIFDGWRALAALLGTFTALLRRCMTQHELTTTRKPGIQPIVRLRRPRVRGPILLW
jgi:hypothetical protein